MRQGWNSRKVEGSGVIITGCVSYIGEHDDALTFRVDTDGVFRTVTMQKTGARIQIEAPGTITITEAPNA